MNVLEVHGLSKTYFSERHAPITALTDISLKVGEREFVSIVGPSGCGKSTLLKILAGLVAPTSGELGVAGRQTSISYHPQNDQLMPWRTTLDNTTLGLELGGISRGTARERAQARFDEFGLAGFERHWPRALSGGMRQRAALLRTFLAGRDALLLDEPFGALDAITREAMREWLLGVWEADRKTVLLVTHDVEEAVFLSDRVYVLSARPGRVALTLDIPFPRPRSLELAASGEFAALKQQVLAPLREERRLRPLVAAQ